MKRTRRGLITVALVALGTVAALAQLKATDQAAVETYRSAIRTAESGGSTRGIEAAFSALASMRWVLLKPQNGQTVLESLPDEDFRLLGRHLPGVVINRSETVYVMPDVDYFTTLAAAQGDGADRAYCAALKTTYPKSVWPVYIEQQADYSGCTRFGSMSLVDTYRAWSVFQSQFPGRYARDAKREIDAVIESLTESTCACGGRAAVEQEFQRFLQGFPTASIRPKINQRLEALRTGRSDIRLECRSG
jgi:hypothetical protein